MLNTNNAVPAKYGHRITTPMRPIKPAVLATTLALTSLIPVQALDYDFEGMFSQDNEVHYFPFSVSSPRVVTVFSSSWIEGGFDPVITLWSMPAGNKIAEQDQAGLGGTAISNGTSYPYGDLDVFLPILLQPGQYLITLSQYDNFSWSSSLSDGFYFDFDPNFTQFFGSQPNFNGAEGPNDARTGAYRLHLLNADARRVPDETSALVLAFLGGLGIAAFRQSQRS